LGITEAENVTNRPGYDNQPFFLPDGSAFWYTVIDDAGQADIWRYDLETRTASQVTRTTPESEYSATPLPDGGFSAVRVEADSAQRLWRFDADGTNPTVLFDSIAPVGYHAWADPSRVVLYVLGEPPVLESARLGQGATGTAASDIGRGMAPIPGTADVSFVQRRSDGGTEIRRLRVGTGRSELIAEGVEGGDFHAWTPAGTLLQAHEARIFAWRPDGSGWTEIADLAELGIRVSRMAVSPDGARIALVGESAS
jgi:Tol biopolymer transport system component